MGDAAPPIAAAALTSDSAEEVVEAEFDRQLESSELRHYSGHRDALWEHVEPHLSSLVKSLSPPADEARDAIRGDVRFDAEERATVTVIRFLAGTAGLGLVLLTLVISPWGAKTPHWIAAHRGIAGAVIFGIFLMVPGFALIFVTDSRSMRKRARENDLRLRQSQEEERLRNAVSERLYQAVNELLGPQGIVPFPTRAPRLVELESRQCVPSTTVQFVRRFIEEHESSAVGIAGTRGSGKSTLMQALRDKPSAEQLSVFMSAPVKYDPVDFARRLLLEIAAVVAPIAVIRAEHQFVARRAAVFRAMVGLVFLTIAPVLIWFDLATGVVDYADRFGPITVVGLLFGGVGLAAFAFLVSHDSPWMRRGRVDTSVDLAAQLIDRLTQEQEREMSSKNGLKILGDVFSFEDQDVRRRKQLALSHADLSGELRKLIAALRLEHPKRRIVIFVDELDKLSSPDDLVAAVNGLKDLFHIQAVHFVVSVSTDALESFERRGLQTRDAFDSAFDTIVRMAPLTPDESLRILASRATGFPPALGLFCHAWAGGLARDLIRNARRCVESQVRASEALPQVEIARQVVSHDLRGLLEGLLRGAPVGELTARGLHDVLATLDSAGLLPGAERRAALEDLRNRETRDDAQRVLTLVCLAMDLVTLVGAGEDAPDRYGLIAMVVARLAEPAALRKAAYDRLLVQAAGAPGVPELAS